MKHLVVNHEKCFFGCSFLEFSGYRLTTAGIATPLTSRVQAIAAFPPPATIKQLQAFLGLFNLYRHFTPAAACIMLPRLEAFEKIPLYSIRMAWNNAGDIRFQNNRITFKIALKDKLLDEIQNNS